MSLKSDLGLALMAAREGGKIALASHGRRDLKTWMKRGEEPVTQVDLEVNRTLKEILIGGRPDYGWLSEESTDDKARLDKEFVWVIDPIDGTRAYMRGNKDFCISIGLLHRNRPVLGVIFAPAMEKMFHAVKGEGAFLNEEQIRVSNPEGLAGIKFQADTGYIGNKKRWGKPWPAMDISKYQSFALRLAAFAAGKVDAVLAAKPKSEWDIAAGAALIEEAGGILCDQDGKAFPFNQENTRLHQIIAISPGLKEEFLKLVKSRIPKNKP